MTMDIDKEWCDFQKKQNVATKMFFNECFNKFKGTDEKEELEDFSALVKKLGIAWNVSRTVPEKEFKKFVKHLYDKLEKIKGDGSYEFWKSTCKFKNNKHAYSYESKICFCINPKKYYLIYDSNNCNKLKEELKLPKKVILSNFHTLAKKYIEELKDKPKTEKDYFETDFFLWYKN